MQRRHVGRIVGEVGARQQLAQRLAAQGRGLLRRPALPPSRVAVWTSFDSMSTIHVGVGCAANARSASLAADWKRERAVCNSLSRASSTVILPTSARDSSAAPRACDSASTAWRCAVSRSRIRSLQFTDAHGFRRGEFRAGASLVFGALACDAFGSGQLLVRRFRFAELSFQVDEPACDPARGDRAARVPAPACASCRSRSAPRRSVAASSSSVEPRGKKRCAPTSAANASYFGPSTRNECSSTGRCMYDGSSRSRRQSAKPSSRGNITSLTIASGFWWRTSSSASRPILALSTRWPRDCSTLSTAARSWSRS